MDRLTPRDEEPIVALCTPQGNGAIALIRISGEGAVEIASKCARLSSGELLTRTHSHTIHHGMFIDPVSSKPIDELLFLLMLGTRTFTGQDTVELSCHNNPLIIEKIIHCLIHQGARPAEAGEFTKRAYLSGKLDLGQAEAIHDIICAQTEACLARSIAQLQGSLSSHLKKIEQLLVELIALLECSFEFLEEEQRDVGFEQLVAIKAEELSSLLHELEQSCEQQRTLTKGMKIVIAGPTNAGKSTLFNKLLGTKRAIVSQQAGTTRDSIEAQTFKHSRMWSLVDTAGIRETDSAVELEGISHTHQELAEADLIVLVVDGQDQKIDGLGEAMNSYDHKVVVAINKTDLGKPSILETQCPQIFISAKTGDGIADLTKAVETKVEKLLGNRQAPFMLNKRQSKQVAALSHTFGKIRSKLSKGVDLEIIASMCRTLLCNLSELTGKDVDRRVTDEIFKSFCIGK